ncbi:MAG: ATP-binding protein [Hyphomicrobiaceae bacterium]|nr:ATP-binding protein [Hyphomicrobiaceae bacterium]
MSARPFLFKRPRLAAELADRLLGLSAFGAEPTLCLAAPRRTGKSTFIRLDLAPELENRHVETVYVDLWSDRTADPSTLIAEAIRAALRRAEGLPLKAARSIGLAKLGVAGVSIDIDKLGRQDGPTLADALESLLERTGKRLALLIDEAQHALVSDAGVNAMFALKAARDRLNTREDAADGPNLAIVLTGSHRDKLSRLVQGRDQPFLGTGVTDFPVLGRAYTDAYTLWLNQRLARDNAFDPVEVHAAFEILGHRPELLIQLLKDIALELGNAGELKTALADGATAIRQRRDDEFLGAWMALAPLQQAVLAHLADRREQVAPFSAPALAAYATAIGSAVEAAAVQSAIAALRDKNLIWKSARGQYALEDQAMGEWIVAHAPSRAVEARPPDRTTSA